MPSAAPSSPLPPMLAKYFWCRVPSATKATKSCTNAKTFRAKKCHKKAAQAQSGYFPTLSLRSGISFSPTWQWTWPAAIGCCRFNYAAFLPPTATSSPITTNSPLNSFRGAFTNIPAKLAVIAYSCHAPTLAPHSTGHIGVVSYPACQFACGQAPRTPVNLLIHHGEEYN